MINTLEAQLVIGVDVAAGQAWLKLVDPERLPVRFGPGQLLMTIEALAMAYAELCGARPESAARGVNRTLRNRTRAAREQRKVGDDR